MRGSNRRLTLVIFNYKPDLLNRKTLWLSSWTSLLLLHSVSSFYNCFTPYTLHEESVLSLVSLSHFVVSEYKKFSYTEKKTSLTPSNQDFRRNPLFCESCRYLGLQVLYTLLFTHGVSHSIPLYLMTLSVQSQFRPPQQP